MESNTNERRLAKGCDCGSHDPWDWVGAAPDTMRLSLLERLQMRGLQLPAPDELTEVALSARLWEMVDHLAQLRTYLLHTDHLSDRALYTEMFEEHLPEPLFLEGFVFGGRLLIDMLGAWDDQDCLLYLKHYADDKDRAAWRESFPGESMPVPEPSPYDRDRWLPKPP